nr:RNA polymerase sigma factor [uncultured Bacteroides sp.]
MDAETFKREYLPFHRKLYFIAYQLLENEPDAEDLVQEAYLKLWDKRDGLVAINNPEAFSVTLVKNMCFDILRSGKYVLSKHAVELTMLADTTEADNLEAKDEVRQVRQLISCLPEQQQKIITLKDVRGCSYEEIERLTGLSSINIRVLLSRARKKIREQFNKLNNYESGRN